MRTILHCDLNNFYASVEIRDNPALAEFPIAVCGSVEDRAGIVLAKNMKAKAFGVKTAEAIWEAKRKCPQLVTVPPRFERYMEFSKAAYDIYARYTDEIEPFGIDEVWLDVTGSKRLFGDGVTIAGRLREEMRKELGLTISVGVSFNKVFAKLGSDMKKPDATTQIPPESWRDIVWPLPASDLLYVGRSTAHKLERKGVHTIGDIAATHAYLLKDWLGVHGTMLWHYANGMDTTPVHHMGWQRAIKSIGNSTTTVRDLHTNDEVHRVMLQLACSVSRRLRAEALEANVVQISVRDNMLMTQEYQCPLEQPTRSYRALTEVAMRLFRTNYKWRLPVRSVGIRAMKLMEDNAPKQFSLVHDIHKQERQERLERAVDRLGERYGLGTVRPAELFGKPLTPNDDHVPKGFNQH